MLFGLFTLLAAFVDVRPIGPEGAPVGFGAVNGFVFELLGVHLFWYRLTDWLGLVPLLTAGGFAAAGLGQLWRRKSLRRVDRRLLALGAFYLVVIAFYLFFERVVINCRPILLGAGPEASYPSSHTVMAVTVMVTAVMELRALCPKRRGLCRAAEAAAGLVAGITAAGRLLSGVHWLTDIVGGLLLSAALTALYGAVLNLTGEDPALPARPQGPSTRRRGRDNTAARHRRGDSPA